MKLRVKGYKPLELFKKLFTVFGEYDDARVVEVMEDDKVVVTFYIDQNKNVVTAALAYGEKDRLGVISGVPPDEEKQPTGVLYRF